MLNTGHPVYIFWGTEGLCFYNDAYRPSLGPERHPHSLGRPAREVWDEIWPLIGWQLDQVMSGGGATWNENRLIPMTRNGRLENVYWTYSYSPIDDETSPTGIGGVLTLCAETTEQVEVADRLTLSEERFRVLADNISQLAWTCDRLGDVTWYNKRWLDYTGLSFEEMKDWGWKKVHHPDHVDRVVASVTRSRESGEPWEDSFPLRGKDGQYRWFLSRAVPIRNDAGEVVRWFGTNTDITDQLESERQLKELAHTLEARVEARTRELIQAEDALRQAQKMEAMGQITGGVAHDFNNLLTPIVGGLDMLRHKGTDDPLTQRLLDGAAESAERARVLVQRLLAFARRQPLQPTAIDVGALVTGIGELLGSTLGPRIRLAVDAPDDLPNARGDAHQLEMALLNLAVNARDAMPDGGQLTVSVAAEELPPDHPTNLPTGNYVRLAVTDTGSGMDEATLKRATEPFFSTKGIGKGTGLGLSMVHGLAGQLGGAIKISSRIGIGTSVELWLPVAKGAQTPDSIQPPMNAAMAKGTVLLVDDDGLVRSSTTDMLVDFGYEVVEACSADEALRMVDQGLRPDFLITDHLMPGMSGVELARNILTRRPDARALIVSGYADVDGIAPDLPRLTKPFKQADLAAAIAELKHEPGRKL